MKKLLLISLVAIITACSENDDIPGLTGDMLIDQIDVVYSNNISFSKHYSYVNGNELSEVSSINGTEEYTYTNGFITKIKYTALPSGTIDERFFNYDANGKLIEEVKLYYSNSVGERIVFSYQDDTTVIFYRYGGNLTSQTTLQASGVYDLESGSYNILKLTETTLSNSQTRVLTYAYDNKKSATHGIKDNMEGFEYLFSGENNVSDYSFKLNGMEVFAYTSTFIYNNDIYPTSERQTDLNGGVNRYSFYYR